MRKFLRPFLILAPALAVFSVPAAAQSRVQPKDRSFSVGLSAGWTQIPSRRADTLELSNPAASAARVTVIGLGPATHEETRERFDREVESVALAEGQAASLRNGGVSFADGAGGTAVAYIRWGKEERTALVACRGLAFRLHGRNVLADDFRRIATSLRCLPGEEAAAPAAGEPAPAFDPAQAPPEAAEMLRTTDDGELVAREVRARERINNAVGFLIVLTLTLGALWLAGILLVFAMRKGLGRACLLAEAHHGRCYLYGAAAFIFPTLGLVLLRMAGPVLAGVMLLLICVGSAAGCVNVAHKLFKIDPVETPMKAYNIGFAVQTALMLVPFFGQMAFLSIVTWGLGGLILLETGARLPEDDIPLPPSPF